MDNPGIYPLAVIDFTGASGVALSPTDDLEGALSVSLEMSFLFGASAAGQTGNVKVQTTFDNWATYVDVARFDFATTSLKKHANLEFLLSKGVTSYADLSGEGVYDGVLGDQLRVVPTWSGNYAGSTLSVRANVR